MKNILLIDDRPKVEAAEEYFGEIGCLHITTDAKKALLDANKINPDLILLDVMLGDHTGFDVAKDLRKSHPATPILFTTGLTDLDDEMDAYAVGAVGFHRKPLHWEIIQKNAQRFLDVAWGGEQIETYIIASSPSSCETGAIHIPMEDGSEALGRLEKLLLARQGVVVVVCENSDEIREAEKVCLGIDSNIHPVLVVLPDPAMPSPLTAAEQELLCLKSGAIGCLRGPLDDPDRLLRLLAKIDSLKRFSVNRGTK